MSDKIFSLPDVQSLDEVPEDFRAFYFEKEGKVQKQNPAAMASTMAKIRRDYDRLEEEKTQISSQYAAVTEALGGQLKPEDIRKLVDKATHADSAHTPEEVQKRLQKAQETAEAEQRKLQAVIKAKESTIEKVAVIGQLVDLLKQAGATEDGLDVLPERLRKRIEVKYLEDGGIELIPLDKDGTKLFGRDGQDASLLDLIQEIKSDRPSLFKGAGNSGGGSSQDTATFTKDSGNWYKMSDAEKIAFQKGKTQDQVNAFIAFSAKSIPVNA